MKLIQCRFSSGQRVPLLVQAGYAAPLPILIVMFSKQFVLERCFKYPRSPLTALLSCADDI